MSKNPVVHFEMPYKDAARVSAFYKEAFGWNMMDGGEQMGHYVMAQTAETDENRMVKTPGTINGGFYALDMSPESTQPSVVIAVDDIRKAVEDIKAAGGELLGEQQEIPGIGLWVSFKDSEGNRVSVLQPNPREAQA